MPKVSKFGSETIIFDETGAVKFRRIMDDNGLVTQDFTPEQCGFVKDLTVSVILRREGFSQRDFLTKTAYFIQTLQCKMPKDRNMKYTFFFYEAKSMSNVCIRDFNAEQYSTQTINVMNSETAKYYGIRLIGKPKRITIEKANALIRDKKVLPQIFLDDGSYGETTAF